ncbi:MAG: hypothetical protein R3D59_16490 [Paracoccaceae bacterium]
MDLILSMVGTLAFSSAAVADIVLDFAPFRYDTARPEVLTLRGEIDERAGYRFKRALASFPNVTTLELISPGGAVYIALPMAYDIHNAGLKTVIPSGSSCASACSFLFFAGKERFAGGQLGVHQVSSGVEDNVDTQITVGDIAAAFDAFNVPTSVLAAMLQTPPNQMRWYQPADLAVLGILASSAPPRPGGGEASGGDRSCARLDAAHAGALDSAQEVVRLYYADLAERRAECAESRWLDPPTDLRESVAKFVDASLSHIRLDRARSTGERAFVDVVAQIATTDGARTEWIVEINLALTTTGWKIEKMAGNAAEDSGQGQVTQTDALGCAIVDTAEPNRLDLVTDVVRFYYADLAAQRVDCARRRWLQAPTGFADRVSMFADATLSRNEIDWQRSGDNHAVVNAIAHITTTDGASSVWRVELSMVPTNTGWKIEEMSGHPM